MATDFVLTLEDGIDQISFIDDVPGAYQLMDDTFSCPVPESEEIQYSRDTNIMSSVTRRSYKHRNITFQYRVKATTYQGVLDNINRIYKMLSRAQSRKGLSGGAPVLTSGYNTAYGSNPYTKTSVFGDWGLVLRVKVGPSVGGTYTDERGQTQTDTHIYTFYVVYGDQEIGSPFSSSGITKKSNSEYYMTDVTLNLVCLPFASSDPRRYLTVTRADAVPYPLNGVTDSSRDCVFYVNDSTIPGNVDALTRTSMDATYSSGILMAIDSGDSIWNTPSVIVNTSKSGAVVSELVPIGKNFVAGKHKIQLKVIGLGPQIQFQYSVDGAAYSATQTPGKGNMLAISLGGGETVNILVLADSLPSQKYTVNDVLAFSSHQRALSINYSSSIPTYDIYANRANARLEDGVVIFRGGIVVQPGITGKYKVYAQINNVSSAVEYKIGVGMFGAGYTSASASTTAWTRARYDDSLVDLGVIDVSPSGALPIGHPNAANIIQVLIYMRISFFPSNGDAVSVPVFYLVPCTEDTSYICAGWTGTSMGYDVITNFDPMNPKMYVTEYDFTDPTKTSGISYSLDSTFAGSVLSVIPESRNSIMVVPLDSNASSADYRTKSAATDSTISYISNVKIAIKPRYLFIG